MLHSYPTLVSKPLIPCRPILCLLPLPPHHRPLLLALLRLLLPLSPPDSLRVLQWNVGGHRAKSTELLHFLLTILSTLSASRNPILTHLPLSGFLDSLLCVLIPHMLAAAAAFLSGKANPFLYFLHPLFFCLIPTLIM